MSQHNKSKGTKVIPTPHHRVHAWTMRDHVSPLDAEWMCHITPEAVLLLSHLS